MTEQHETFPGRFEALLLIALLIFIELAVYVVVRETGLLAGSRIADIGGYITVVGNGILFIGLMAYKRIGYRELFHPAKHSVAATMALVTAPILLIVPGLALLTTWAGVFVERLFPVSAEDAALYEALVGSGVLSILFRLRGGAGARGDAISRRDAARLPAAIHARLRHSLVGNVVRHRAPERV